MNYHFTLISKITSQRIILWITSGWSLEVFRVPFYEPNQNSNKRFLVLEKYGEYTAANWRGTTVLGALWDRAAKGLFIFNSVYHTNSVKFRRSFILRNLSQTFFKFSNLSLIFFKIHLKRNIHIPKLVVGKVS